MAELAIACVDNHAVVRAGIVTHLREALPEARVVASTATVDALLSDWPQPDVVLLDLLLAGGVATPAIPELVRLGARVLLYTAEERPAPLRKAVAAGAHGVLLKSDPLETVAVSVRRVAAGEFCVSGPLAHALLTDERLIVDLSEQQVQVLRCIDEGLDYRSTARVLGVSETTVKTYLARIREKYCAAGYESGNSHLLTRYAVDQGHLD